MLKQKDTMEIPRIEAKRIGKPFQCPEQVEEEETTRMMTKYNKKRTPGGAFWDVTTRALQRNLLARQAKLKTFHFCGNMIKNIYRVECVFTTESEPNLFREDNSYKDKLWAIPVINWPSLLSGNNEKVGIVGAILLHSQTEDVHVRVVFRFRRNMAVSTLLETFFTDKYVNQIYVSEHRSLLYNSVLILIDALVIQKEIDDKRKRQEVGKISNNVAVIEDEYEALRLVLVVRKMKIPHKS